jgi:hypothetical protein
MEPNKKPTYNIRVFGTNCIVDITSPSAHGVAEGVVRTTKTIKLDSLIKAFKNAETKISSPILPVNTIRYQEEGSNVAILLYHEPTTFTATCFGKTYENCCRPGLIMKYILGVEDKGEVGKEYSIHDTKCFGLVDSQMLLNSKSQLYGLPFPNISSEGWICWGSNSIAGKVKSLTGLGMYVNRLFNSPFNDHIFHNALLKNYGINSPEDLFKYIQGKERFPTELLENLGRNFTLGTL